MKDPEEKITAFNTHLSSLLKLRNQLPKNVKIRLYEHLFFPKITRERLHLLVLQMMEGTLKKTLTKTMQ